MEKVECKECDRAFTSNTGLYNHITHTHLMDSKSYVVKHFGGGFCKECKKPTNFRGLGKGFSNFCSKGCGNTNRSKNPLFVREYSQKSREMASERQKEYWRLNREFMMGRMNDPERLKKLSIAGANSIRHKKQFYIDGIRCESSHEGLFVKMCKIQGHRIVRFCDDSGNLSMHLENDRVVLPDFKLDNVIVDVKAFHHWFERELFSGLEKYKLIVDWCRKRDFIFMFWFRDYGYHLIESFDNVIDKNSLEKFKDKHKNAFSRHWDGFLQNLYVSDKIVYFDETL